MSVDCRITSRCRPIMRESHILHNKPFFYEKASTKNSPSVRLGCDVWGGLNKGSLFLLSEEEG